MTTPLSSKQYRPLVIRFILMSNGNFIRIKKQKKLQLGTHTALKKTKAQK